MSNHSKYERFFEIFGMSPSSWELLCCVMACESTEWRHPTRKECSAIVGFKVCSSELLRLGYLDISAKNKPKAKLIATRRAWREFGSAPWTNRRVAA